MNVRLKIYSTNHMSFHVQFYDNTSKERQENVATYNIITGDSGINLAFLFNTDIFNYDESILRRDVIKLIMLKYKAKEFESSLEKYKKERTWYLT